jgi:hypothetical protein
VAVAKVDLNQQHTRAIEARIDNLKKVESNQSSASYQLERKSDLEDHESFAGAEFRAFHHTERYGFHRGLGLDSGCPPRLSEPKEQTPQDPDAGGEGQYTAVNGNVQEYGDSCSREEPYQRMAAPLRTPCQVWLRSATAAGSQ